MTDRSERIECSVSKAMIQLSVLAAVVCWVQEAQNLAREPSMCVDPMYNSIAEQLMLSRNLASNQ
jgi:hypothetical protein